MVKIKKVRKTEEEEVVNILKRRGFVEIPMSEIEKEPYKTIYELPECFQSESRAARHKVKEEKKG